MSPPALVRGFHRIPDTVGPDNSSGFLEDDPPPISLDDFASYNHFDYSICDNGSVKRLMKPDREITFPSATLSLFPSLLAMVRGTMALINTTPLRFPFQELPKPSM